jgi:tRNA(Arg) A34 adenosine deaminase TadA
MSDLLFMQEAIAKAKEGIAAGQSPFGAVIMRAGVIVVAAHNTVWRDLDPTAHAEVNAIRQAARLLNTIFLSDCDMFTTCEPCPMCLAAIHWSRIRRVVCGASIADAAAAGFRELQIPACEMVQRGGSPLQVEAGVCQHECCQLFTLWRDTAKSQAY